MSGDPTPTERLQEAVEILRRHNIWRRGMGDSPQMSPARIGAAIDVVCELVPDLLAEAKS